MYTLLIDQRIKNYQLKIKNESGIKTVIVEGVQFEKFPEQASGNPLLSFSEIDNSASLLSIKTFSSGEIIRQGQDCYQFLEATFRSLSQANTQNLIIDLRGNEGGVMIIMELG